jgi:hypothetical protein
MRAIFPILILALLAGCASKKKIQDTEPRARRFNEWKATEFHEEIKLNIGWYPYQTGAPAREGDQQWKVVFEDSVITGSTPVIIIKYPDSTKAMTLSMDIDDALLGKLLKHSLMTEMPIERPFTEYLKTADCAQCHPAEIELNSSFRMPGK